MSKRKESCIRKAEARAGAALFFSLLLLLPSSPEAAVTKDGAGKNPLAAPAQTPASSLEPSSAPPQPKRPSTPRVSPAPVADKVLDGITFAEASHTLYLPARELSKHFSWSMHWDRRARVLYFGKLKAKKEQVRWLMDGTRVLPLRLLKSCGFSVSWDGARRMARLRHKDRELWVRRGVKRVAVNRRAQRMRAWQGDRLLLDSHVSTGARGYTTPAGSFMAGPFKSPMAISHKYGDSPMPWCVQVHNNVCIHGYHSVPPRPASHGCIRVPLRGQNPARWFYQWVDVGTPVTVGDRWPAPRAVI